MTLPTLRFGSNNDFVVTWKAFLRGKDFYIGDVSPMFDAATRVATMDFQRLYGLVVDGVVGQGTWGAALGMGLDTTGGSSDAGSTYPPAPDFGPSTAADRDRMYGHIDYVAAPALGNPENILIVNDWAAKNIIDIDLQQLPTINKVVYVHRLVADRLKDLWDFWDTHRLLKLVITFDGMWAPRFIRGSRSILSSHAHGSAFDINARWNSLSVTPATPGKLGSVWELVASANERGWYWGGHFPRKDGMHFQLDRLQ